MATFVAYSGVDFDYFDLTGLIGNEVLVANSTTFSLTDQGEVATFFGTGFTYDADSVPTGGIVTRIADADGGVPFFNLTGISIPATQFVEWTLTADNLKALQTVFAGADSLTGSNESDLMTGFAGDDYILGGAGDDSLGDQAGSDTILGGAGNDVIVESEGSNYLRGDDGNDIVLGGTGFDDINGNAGNDSLAGGAGNDWVVGGKDNDKALGGDGDDIVYGNLGNDTVDGGAGADIVRGGQQNDSLTGGAGDDWLSGDRDSDTLSGGAGADIFHTFGDAGIDRVLDFSRAEGDRVQLDPGTHYTVSQVGADTVINMDGGGQMILVGVQMSSLTGDWIFGA